MVMLVIRPLPARLLLTEPMIHPPPKQSTLTVSTPLVCSQLRRPPLPTTRVDELPLDCAGQGKADKEAASTI
jgi:hypothetical protein